MSGITRKNPVPDTIVKLYSGPIKVLTNTSSTFNGGLAIVEGRDKNQVAGLELTETFLLCGRAAQKTHTRNIVVFFHPMSQIQVASGKFDAATTEASITRLEEADSAAEAGEHRRSRKSIQPHPNIRKGTPSDT